MLLFSNFIFSSSSLAKEYLSPEELEKWFNSDDEYPASKVNEGELSFITAKTNKNIFGSVITIHVNQHSIDEGWTTLTQCYSNLDPVPRTAVVYRKNLIKDLKVDDCVFSYSDVTYAHVMKTD